MNRGSRSRAARRAREVALDWTLLVTRGLPQDVVRDRFDQIVSDLWEHVDASDRAGASGVRLAAQILRRTLLGVPADLAWRLDQQHRARTASAHRGTAAAPRLLPASAHRFDQTNGAIEFDAPGRPAAQSDLQDLLGTAVRANAISVGFGGGI